MTFLSRNMLVLTLSALMIWVVLPNIAKAQQSQDFSETLKKAQEGSYRLSEQEKEDARNAPSNSPVLLELFTATNCTACVFADRMLYDSLTKNRKVIALSCHIKDLSALRGFDEKQKQDSAINNSGPMDPCIFRQWAYTPKGNTDVSLSIPSFIFNGYDILEANDLDLYETTLRSYQFGSKNQALDVFVQWKDSDTLSINLPSDPKTVREKGNASVWLIRYKDIEVEKVSDGVNKGRVLRFSNVVQDVTHIGKWHGAVRKLDVDVKAPPGGKDSGGYVVVVQETMGAPVIAVGKISDYPVKAPAKNP